MLSENVAELIPEDYKLIYIIFMNLVLLFFLLDGQYLTIKEGKAD